MNFNIKKIKYNIEKYDLIKSGDNVLLGLSGGPDSIMLFYGLIYLKKEINFNIYVAHINHLYRGQDAYNDEEFVKKLCIDYDIDAFFKREDASKLAMKKKITEEEAGREIRYNFFKKVLKDIGGGVIATAHNKNDQGETLLQRIIRGTGIEGLVGMDYKQGNIIRPILNIDREEIIKFLEINGYEYCIDQTNKQPIYGRNKIRLELIPYIEKKFNDNISETLFRLSENMKDDFLIIKEEIEKSFDEVLIKREENKIILNIDKILEKSKGIRSRILRKAIEEIKGNKVDVERRHIDYIDELVLKKETGKKIDLGKNILAEISYEKLIIKIKDKIKNYKYNIYEGLNYIKEINKNIVLRDNKRIRVNKDRYSILIDKDMIQGQLIVRNRQNGDKFQPLGMKGSKKLKDYFIDEKISKGKRDKIPLLCDEENIIWVVGYRMNHKYRLTDTTKNTLTVEIREA